MRNARRIVKIEYAKTPSFDMGNKIIVDWVEENDKFSVLTRMEMGMSSFPGMSCGN